MRPTAATKPSFFLAGSNQPATAAAGVVVAADPCKLAKKKEKKNKRSSSSLGSCRSWRTAAAGSDGADSDSREEDGSQFVSTRERGRRARLSARRRESIRLLDVLEDGDDDAGGSRIGEFLRHPAGVESLLNTTALQTFVPVKSSDPGDTFRCTLHPIGFLGFKVAPVLDLRVTPTSTDCTVEMLSCRFEGSDSIEQQNELFSAVMRNHITWGDNGEDQPCLDIDVDLEVTLEVYTKPFSLLPLSAVEKPGNLLMQGLLDRLVSMLGEQLLRDYLSWIQKQQQQPESFNRETAEKNTDQIQIL